MIFLDLCYLLEETFQKISKNQRINEKLLKYFVLSDKNIGHRVSRVRSLWFAAREGSVSLSFFLFSLQRPAHRAQIQRRHFARPWYYWPELTDIVSLAVDAVSDNRGGNDGAKDGAVGLSNSYCLRVTRTEGGDSTTFIFSGNGGNTLFWNWPDTLPTGS